MLDLEFTKSMLHLRTSFLHNDESTHESLKLRSEYVRQQLEALTSEEDTDIGGGSNGDGQELSGPTE